MLAALTTTVPFEGDWDEYFSRCDWKTVANPDIFKHLMVDASQEKRNARATIVKAGTRVFQETPSNSYYEWIQQWHSIVTHALFTRKCETRAGARTKAARITPAKRLSPDV